MSENEFIEALKRAESLSQCELTDAHGELVEPLRESYLQRQHFLRSVKPDRAWASFMIRAFKPLIVYTLPAAAVLILLVLLLFQRGTQEEQAMIADIMPAEGEVILKLSDGKPLAVHGTMFAASVPEGMALDEQSSTLHYGMTSLAAASNKKTLDPGGAGHAHEITYHELHVPKGKTFSLVLSDGTRLWVNSESTVRYPVHFGRELREVELEGEAFFEVMSGLESAFVVKTSSYAVHVAGTRFNVKSYPDEDLVATTLVSGSVAIPASTHHAGCVMMPGEQYRYMKTADSAVLEQVDTSLYTSWMENRLRMRSTSLWEIAVQLQRTYDVGFAFENESLKSVSYTGVIPLNENLQVILGQLAKVSSVQFEITDDLVFISSKL